MKDSLVRTDVDCNNRDAFESVKTRSSGKLWSGAYYSMATLALTTLLEMHRKFDEKKWFDDWRTAARLIQGGKLSKVRYS